MTKENLTQSFQLFDHPVTFNGSILKTRFTMRPSDPSAPSETVYAAFAFDGYNLSRKVSLEDFDASDLNGYAHMVNIELDLGLTVNGYTDKNAMTATPEADGSLKVGFKPEYFQSSVIDPVDIININRMVELVHISVNVGETEHYSEYLDYTDMEPEVVKTIAPAMSMRS